MGVRYFCDYCEEIGFKNQFYILSVQEIEDIYLCKECFNSKVTSDIYSKLLREIKEAQKEEEVF